ncbi:class I SAM-dependent methyltransferase [Natronobacterium gregoryi]|uniref:Class I SAM-dependent methyltransferase n=2 Tax=Natronobacterium gregoryi TaxID=44930 RepID=L0AK79_NATGS|nr:class I SAM-dependent methyltransferase [Natronobacterium gregoryi]AFZ73859.1 methylase involved in ubiquinone/menaquinone biosynthesis [Natronobacterium gregoryi SP2]PLK19727.1 class I SAM-dependent methyltransferase [Natronobacterium gregoryi SP2]SFJ42649.1 Methyltransferase domain-containing protein [Natronobacterium gregoryi]
MTRPQHSDGIVKDAVRKYWNGRADEYDDDGISGVHTDTQREAWLSLLRELTTDGTRRVLDLGCGTGTVSLLLAELGYDVTGLDISSGMLERARSKARKADCTIEYHTGDAETLPFAENAFDVVTARHLIWTLPHPETAIDEWRRVVQPGGRLVLVEGYWDFDEPWEGYREIHDALPLYDGRPPTELVAFLADHGLEDVDCEPLMDPVFWGQRPDQELYVVTIDVPT